jgi:hypothetical protein
MSQISLQTRARRKRMSRFAFGAVAVGMAMAFFGAIAYHVYRLDFRPLAAFGVPILLAFFGFSSLLYLRGRSLAKGSAQFRSLFAAERAMQGAVWHLSGIIVGTSLYSLLAHFGVSVDAGEASVAGLWILLLFLAPYALMQVGLLSFMRAVWVVAPHFFRSVGPLEIRRRVEQ